MPVIKTTFDTQPAGMSYADWMKSKNVGLVVKGTCNEAGIPTEFLSKHKPVPELFKLNKERQGKVLAPEDI